MTTMEGSTTITEGDQKQKILSPSDEDSPPVPKDSSASMNFSELTPCQFGISVQSFTPALQSNCKDKSRLAQIKARRKSSVGVRGSPETNSLIRFMAQQKMKTPPTLQTPKLVRSSPLIPRVSSTLRQKMASFQNLMNVEESEVYDLAPVQDGNTGGSIKTRDYLSDMNRYDGQKENLPSQMTPIPSKRRRLGPLETCQLEISLKEREESKEPTKQLVAQEEAPPARETLEEALAVLISPPLPADTHVQVSPPSKDQQQDSVFELQSPSPPLPDDPAASPPARPTSSLLIHSLSSQLEMKPAGEDGVNAKPAVKNKKKSVRFGGPLSPEFFDKNLPPSTPLQKGGTPARAPTPGRSLQLRSLLKTPQRSESQTPPAQLDSVSPTMFGASPTLAMPRNHRMQSLGEDGEEKDAKIVFPSLEELDPVVPSYTEFILNPQPLNLDTAFYEESLSLILPETEAKPSETSPADGLPSLSVERQFGEDIEAPAKSRKRRKKQGGRESTGEAPPRSSSRKRKQPEENEPAKRPTRSAAKSASGKIKMTSTSKRNWNKEVDRSLYSSRAFASKNPNLSPIRERLSFIIQCPASHRCAAPTHETNEGPEVYNSGQTVGDPTATNTSETPSEVSSRESCTEENGSLSEPRIIGRGLERRTVSVTDELSSEENLDQDGGKMKNFEDQTATNREAVRGTPRTHAVPGQRGVAPKPDVQTSADTHSTDVEGTLESPVSLDLPTTDSNHTVSLHSVPAQRKVKRGRRSALNHPVLQDQGAQEEDLHKNLEVAEMERGPLTVSHQQLIRFGEDSVAASLNLAPWQADFNFEDVFKPVPTRGQRSVRRSLRNVSSAEQISCNSTGLAWLPRTSPDSIRETRRRTRGRRLSAATTDQTSPPEEGHENHP